jgi:hypothetical protein
MFRNREHARNTRERKKAYVETLKDTVANLCEEHKKVDRDRRIAVTRLAEQVCGVCGW